MTLRLVVATSNPGKLREVRAILADLPVELAAVDASVVLPGEGDGYVENALAKARAVAEQCGLWAVADDSGLEVEALGGAPGPHSARFGGPGLDDAGRIQLLLDTLGDRPAAERRARFVCVAAWAAPEGDSLVSRGECTGHILTALRGRAGFGYDPVFQLDGSEQTMAELGAAEKNQRSHRGRAFRALARELRPKL